MSKEKSSDELKDCAELGENDELYQRVTEPPETYRAQIEDDWYYYIEEDYSRMIFDREINQFFEKRD